MNQNQLKLQPWITVNPKLKGLPGYITYNEPSNLNQPCSLISILAIQYDHLDQLSALQIPAQTEDTAMAYISDIITYSNKNIRLVYVPPNKNNHQTVQYFSDLLRELSEVVISDINNIGLNKIKAREGSQNKKYVLVNGRDIYRAEYGQNQIELIKKVEVPFLQAAYQHIQSISHIKSVNLIVINSSLKRYSKYWQLLVGAQKSWTQLGLSTIEYYRALLWLTEKCPKWFEMREKNKLLSNIELELIHQDIVSNCQGLSSLQMTTVREIAHQIMNDIKNQNFSKQVAFLFEMQTNYKQNYISSPRQIPKNHEQIVQTLRLYGLSQQCAAFITFPLQKLEMEEKIGKLTEQISHLNRKICEYDLRIQQKNSQINDFKDELREYSCKFVHLIDIQQKCQEIVEELESLRDQNRHLASKVEKHVLMEKKYLSAKEELEVKVSNMERENKGMLECLKQLTQESLSLHTKIDQQRNQISELKEQIQDNTQIQVRALRSIQNQAEIKTRLQRYENYVSQLKSSFKSFKKLQSEKFNYILLHNYKQYAAVKDQLKKITYELKREKSINQQLTECLQREKARMGYFQKFLRSNYQNQPIPQCSEENSATDRESSVVE